MTPARIASVAAVAAAVVLVAFVLLRGGGSYTVTVRTVDAGQIVKGDEVKVGAANVGTVTAVSLGRDGLADIELSINDDARPLRHGTRAAIRATSLAGSANRYVVLTPGGMSQPPIPDGGRIESLDTTAPVDFDAVLNTLDEPTRDGLGLLIHGAGQQYGSRTDEARRTLRYLAPALTSNTALLRELSRDRTALSRLIVRGSVAASAVAGKRSELTQLIGNANTTARAIGDESTALNRSLQLLPGTLREANTTFVNLRSTIDDLDPLVAASLPATRDLAPFLRRLRPLVADAVPAVRDLAAVIDAPGPRNDLVELVAGLPRLEQTSAIATPRTIRAMDRSQPLVDTLLAYTPDIAAATAHIGQAASYYDSNGHYLRLQPSLFALGYDAPGNQLVPRSDSERLSGLELGTGARCPGGAMQAPPDGSAPVQVPGCSTATTPPGP